MSEPGYECTSSPMPDASWTWRESSIDCSVAKQRGVEVALADVALGRVVLGRGRHEHAQRLVVARVVDDARVVVQEVRHVGDLALRLVDEARVGLGAAVVEPLQREVLERRARPAASAASYACGDCTCACTPTELPCASAIMRMSRS